MLKLDPTTKEGRDAAPDPKPDVSHAYDLEHLGEVRGLTSINRERRSEYPHIGAYA